MLSYEWQNAVKATSAIIIYIVVLYKYMDGEENSVAVGYKATNYYLNIENENEFIEEAECYFVGKQNSMINYTEINCMCFEG